MRKSFWAPLLVIIILILLTFIAGRFFYYSSSANAYTPPQRELTDVKVEDFPRSARVEARPVISKSLISSTLTSEIVSWPNVRRRVILSS